MKTVIVESKRRPFREEWTACLKKAPRNARVATLPELAAARASAPYPHTPGKPWETYYDGTSPLWETWLMTGSCLLLGQCDGQATVTVVHGLEPGTSRDERNGEYFLFPQETWSRVLAQTPASQRMSTSMAESCRLSGRDDGCFTAMAMTDNAFFRALFGSSLDAYADVHRAIASQYLVCRLKYADRYDSVPVRHKQLLTDPPIITLDVDWISKAVPPTTGAIGKYFCLENIMNISVRELSPCGETRRCELDMVGPKDDSRFLIAVD